MGVIAASQAQFDVEPINRCLVRITKGIVATSHPEIDRNRLDFEITQIDQFKPESLVSSGIVEKLTRWSVGEGVYTNWRAFDKANLSQGIMVHMFYDAAIWMVKFGPGSGRVTVHGLQDWSHLAPGSF